MKDIPQATKNVLRKIKANPEINLRSVPESTGKFLHFLVLATQAKSILELGCAVGYSTIWMAIATKRLGGHVYTTEFEERKAKLASQHFVEAGVLDVITLIEGDIKKTLAQWKYGLLDFVFMDADKSEYHIYYDAIMPHMKRGGIIIADNAVNCKHLMQPFFEQVNTDPQIFAHLMDLDSGLLLIFKE